MLGELVPRAGSLGRRAHEQGAFDGWSEGDRIARDDELLV
jgi:hypothetical protein